MKYYFVAYEYKNNNGLDCKVNGVTSSTQLSPEQAYRDIHDFIEDNLNKISPGYSNLSITSFNNVQ